MDIKILKEKMSNGETHYGFEITNHGFKGHLPTISNWFSTVDGFERTLIHHIEQHIGRRSKVKKDR